MNDAALAVLLRSREGPVGRDLARRAELVAEQARQNASGEIIGIRTGDLIAGIHIDIAEDPAGLRATVGTRARHRGFAYPAFQDRTGRPWLTSALRRAAI
jgi:hypothetical protein